MTTLITEDAEQLRAIARRRRVHRLGAFGSAVTNEFDVPRGDIDILVEFEDLEPIQRAKQYFGLPADFEALFARPVDPVERSALRSPCPPGSIEASQVVLYAKARHPPWGRNGGRVRIVRLVVLALSITSLAIAQPTGSADRTSISVAGAPWELSFPSAGWTLQQQKQRDDGKGVYFMYGHGRHPLWVSFFIEPAEKCATSEECRALYWRDPGPAVKDPTDVTQFLANGFAIVRFVVPTFRGQKVNQLNYSGHLVRDGFWIDMHLSTVSEDPAREKLLSNFVDGIRISAKLR